MTLFPDWLLMLLALIGSGGAVDDLSTPLARPGSQREPVAVTVTSSPNDASRLTFAELLAWMPSDPCDRRKIGSDANWASEGLELRRRVDAHAISDDEWRAAVL